MARREAPITRVRGTTTVIELRVLYRGGPANLAGKTLKFAISDEESMAQVILKQSGSGVTQDEQGLMTVTIPASDLKFAKVPLDRYWWEARLFDGPKEYEMASGPFVLKPSPFQ